MGMEGSRLTLLHHPSGRTGANAGLGGPGRAAEPVEWLYNDLKNAGVDVRRVGDCVAPRRAHAAVVDG